MSGRAHARERLNAFRIDHLGPIADASVMGIPVTFVLFGGLAFSLPDPPAERGSILVMPTPSGRPKGPGGIHLRSLRKVLASAHGACIMPGEAPAEAYKAAADLAGAGLRVVVIETQIAEERPWLDFVSRHAPDAVTEVVNPTALDLLLKRRSKYRPPES
jgi:hypothetical protein